MAPAVPVVFKLFPGIGSRYSLSPQLGLHAAHGIDHVVVPEGASSPLIADLTTEEGQQLASFWITNPLLSAVFAAPPCGTCNRAREIPLAHSKDLRPQPVRDALHPDGLPSLQGVGQQRVISANRTWPRLQPCATAEQFPSRVKNPRRPWFWNTSFFQGIAHLCPFRVTFDHCAFGGHRPNVPRLHPPWTVFLA